MSKTPLAVIGIASLIVLAFVGYTFGQRILNQSAQQSASKGTQDGTSQIPLGGTLSQVLFDNIKTPHFESSEPNNNAKLTTPPTKVAINFNFDLVTPSEIKVTRDGSSVTTGTTQISENKLSMSVPIDATQPGNYKVAYTACWPDGTCHDGSFGFSVKL